MRITAALATFLLSLSVASATSSAQQTDVGKTEFRLRCAACHGPSGKGDGMIGQMLKVQPSDLSRIAERNGGKFPFARVYQIIDGRLPIAAHGTSDMPIWGDHYRADQFPMETPSKGATEAQIDAPERAVERHILALIYFIGTLQETK